MLTLDRRIELTNRLCYLFVIFLIGCLTGWIAIRCFGMRLWDYRGLFGNISGIICVRSVVSFALLGLVFHYLIEPSTERVMGRLSRRAVYGGCAMLAVLLLTDCILSALYRTPITY